MLWNKICENDQAIEHAPHCLRRSSSWSVKWKKTERQQHKRREGTYSCSLHKGHSRTELDWASPVAKESKEQLWDGVAAIVRLHERTEERREDRGAAQLTMKTGDYAEIEGRHIRRNGLMNWLRGWWDTYPTSTGPLTLCKEQRRTLQHCPRRGPVLPVGPDKTRTRWMWNFRNRLKLSRWDQVESAPTWLSSHSL